MAGHHTPLSQVIEMAERRRDRRLQQAGEARRLVIQAQATLDALEQFRAERLARRRALVGEPGQPVAQQVIESHFDTKLVAAVKAQGERLMNADRLQEERRQAVQAAQSRVAALQLLARRRAEKARRHQEKTEQRVNDDIVAGTAKPSRNATP